MRCDVFVLPSVIRVWPVCTCKLNWVQNPEPVNITGVEMESFIGAASTRTKGMQIFPFFRPGISFLSRD